MLQRRSEFDLHVLSAILPSKLEPFIHFTPVQLRLYYAMLECKPTTPERIARAGLLAKRSHQYSRDGDESLGSRRVE